MPRSVPEWIGRTDDTPIPPRVKDRIRERDNGMCNVCGLEVKAIETPEFDHRPALVNGGENRESKIFLVHAYCHSKLTQQDKKTKAKTTRIRQRHAGIKQPAGQIQSRPFDYQKKGRPALWMQVKT